MSIESFATNPPIVTRAHGLARLLPAAFLGFWLCGWAAGEGFALVTVVNALSGMLGFALPAGWPRIPIAGPTLPIVAFLAVWLAFWTVGGVAAMSALALMLWGREELSWGPEGILLVQSAAPFRFEKRLPWGDVWRIEDAGRGVTISARGGRRTLAAGASAEERASILNPLREAFRASRPDAEAGRWELSDPPAPANPDLPAGWRAEPDETGALAARESPRARVVAGIALVCFAAVLVLPVGRLFAEAGARGWTLKRGAAAGAIALLQALMAWGGVVTALTRQSLHARSGAILRRVRRFGRVRETTWSPARLALGSRVDGDGDESWALEVSGGGSAPATFASTLRDPGPALALGRWLAGRAGVPFEGAVANAGAGSTLRAKRAARR